MTEAGKYGFIPSNYLTKIDDKVHKDDVTSKAPAQVKKPMLSTRAENYDHKQIQATEFKVETPDSKIAKSLSFGEIELDDLDIFGYISDASFQDSISDNSLNGSEYSEVVEPFVRKSRGKYLVLHNYYGEDENDATILKGKIYSINLARAVAKNHQNKIFF